MDAPRWCEMVDARRAAEVLEVSNRTIWRYADDGFVTAIRLWGRRTRFCLCEVMLRRQDLGLSPVSGDGHRGDLCDEPCARLHRSTVH